MSKVKDSAQEICQQIAAKQGVRLVDIEYTKTHTGMNLNIYIDKQGGITLDDLTAFSHAADSIFDEVDITAGAKYTLNVSSPGLDRKFKTTEDFQAATGKDVEIRLFAPFGGKKEYIGLLKSANNEAVEIYGKEDEVIEIERSKIAAASYHIKW